MRGQYRNDEVVTIYALSDPSNPRIPKYIGRTRGSTRQRMYQHISKALGGHRGELFDWLRNLDKTNKLPAVLVYERILGPQAKERERFWITLFRPLGLLNVSDGEGAGRNARISELNRQKTIARNKLGLSESTKTKIGNANRGKWDNGRRWLWMQHPNVKKLLVKAKERLSVMSENNKRKVICIETGQVFCSVKEAKGSKNTAWLIRQMKHGCAYKGKHYKYADI